MKLSFFGSCEEVGRSSILVECNEKLVMLDAGIKIAREKNEFPEIPLELPAKLSAVILSHGHLDHVGFVPVLVKHGFKGKIYCTKPTRDLMQLLLADALKIAREKKQNLFSQHDMEKALKLVHVLPFNKTRALGRNFSFKFLPAGHIVGSAQTLLKCNGKHLLYSSDINNRETNLLQGLKIAKEKIDFLIVESTYGSKNDLLPSLQKASKDFADAVSITFILGGKVLVPVFAIGRGQEIMLVLENYIRSGYLPEDTVVFVDGMINGANRICRQNVSFLRPEIPNRILQADSDPFKSPFIKVPKTRNKSDVFKAENAVILATSGMLTAGPSVSYFQRLAKGERNLIALVGFQSSGSLGRELLEGKRLVELKGKKIEVKASVQKFAFSGHADFLGLLDYVRKNNPSRVFVVHGDSEKQKEFALVIKNKLKKESIIPKNGEVFEL